MLKNKIKLLTVIGARPQIMKSAVLSKAIDKSSDFTEILVHTGQHYDRSMSSSIMSELFDRKLNYKFKSGGRDEISMTAYMIEKLKNIIKKEKPEYLVVFGDTTSTLAAALAGKKMLIPVIHIESGVRNYDNNMPEEFNRIVVDRISDINICATNQSLINLKKENFGTKQIPCSIAFCGDLMLDCYNHFKSNLHNDDFLNLPLRKFINKDFIFCTIHRQSNVDNKKNLENIVEALNQISDQIPVILPLHHRTRKRIKQYGLKLRCNVIQPITYFETVKFLKKCKFVITDSGGLVREAFFSKKLSICILEKTMWPEINHLNASIGCRPKSREIIKNFCELSKMRPNFKKKIFGTGNASKKILKLIKSHYKKIKL